MVRAECQFAGRDHRAAVVADRPSERPGSASGLGEGAEGEGKSSGNLAAAGSGEGDVVGGAAAAGEGAGEFQQAGSRRIEGLGGSGAVEEEVEDAVGGFARAGVFQGGSSMDAGISEVDR